MTAVEREFEALWSDGAATLSPDEVRTHYAAILAEYRKDSARAAADVVGVSRGAGAPLDVLREAERTGGSDDPPHLRIAFSSRLQDQAEAAAGYAEANRLRRFEMYKPSGKTKRVPVTLSTLALDTIARARPGEHLLVAMYVLSTRVPEYGALLEAARRGVRLFIVLDGHVGDQPLSRVGHHGLRKREAADPPPGNRSQDDAPEVHCPSRRADRADRYRQSVHRRVAPAQRTPDPVARRQTSDGRVHRGLHDNLEAACPSVRVEGSREGSVYLTWPLPRE